MTAGTLPGIEQISWKKMSNPGGGRKLHVEMRDVNDMELLREYATGNSQQAFSELVRRHINLVYSVALRYTRAAADAEDVVQAVFIILARKAGKLGPKTILTGWLYETTRLTAMNLLRSRARQSAREQEVYMQSNLEEAERESLWKQLSPMLEEGMSRLSEKERTLLALRFFENKSGAETAALLGVQAAAAHRRTSRAVEKLRIFFRRRGIVVPTSAMTVVISAHSVQAAPSSLVGSVTAVAVIKGTAVSGSVLTLIKGALQVMAWAKIKTTAITGAIVLLATATFAASVYDAIRMNADSSSTAGVHGAENAATAGDSTAPVRQLTDLYNLLSTQDSLSIAATETDHYPPGAEMPETTGTYKLLYKNKHFLYDAELVGAKGPYYSVAQSCDGKYYQYLDRSGGLLYISTKPVFNDVIMPERHLLFMPFLFVQSAFASHPYAQVSYSQLTNSGDWQNSLKTLQQPGSLTEVSLDNQPYLKASNIGFILPREDPKGPCTFDVYFSKQFNGYPMKWDEKFKTSETNMTYTVQELGYIALKSGGNLPYPKKATIEHYWHGKLTDTDEVEIKDIRFGTVSDNDIFIDPASARTIRDLDKRTTVHVPY
jgi:RNA polymerase sigma factor (sigma-70 family)